MPDLIAQGPEARQRWRRLIPPGSAFRIGRQAGLWSVRWDPHVSREHVELTLSSRGLLVRRLPDTRNPVFFQGQPEDSFCLESGDHFVIGQTTFTLADEQVSLARDFPPPASERTFSSAFLQNLRFRNAETQIDALSRLPNLIVNATNDHELFSELTNLLLTSISQADTVAILRVAKPEMDVQVLHWDRRGMSREEFAPSVRLIQTAVASGQRILHCWNHDALGRERGKEGAIVFTQRDDVDWVFCIPVRELPGEQLALYVSGRFSFGNAPVDEQSQLEILQDDLKFSELAAGTLGNLRALRSLEQRQASLKPFFAPVVLEALAHQDPDRVLAPRETQVSVMFCDLRGFSVQSERNADDLAGLLERVSDALGIMTHAILTTGGVVGDFHGDAAMGFWGWPLEQPTYVEDACRAALNVARQFERQSRGTGRSLSGFQVGIGIASGLAFAGKIGTVDQVKVTVFGPVANLAARLEDMTKVFRAPILVDEATAQYVRSEVSRDVLRVRRVARVRPPGMTAAVEINQLLPPYTAYPTLRDEDIDQYEAALDALLAGDWEQAFTLLHAVPAEDRVKDFMTVLIARHNRTPPADWDGVVPVGL